MRTILETLETPVYGEYDVVVVGAGPAGCGAALSAARGGAKVLLLERANCLGGAWTTGFMNPLFDWKNKTGILAELIAELRARDAWGGFWDESFRYEVMKVILEEKMREAGVKFLFGTTFSRALTDGKRVTGVVAENRGGRFAYLAKIVFDCTGDGNVAADAGCEFEIGDAGDVTRCQPMTLMFLVANVPPQYAGGLKLTEKLDRVYELGKKEIPFRRGYLIPAPGADYAVIQFTHMYEYDPLSEESVTAATVEGRRQMFEAVGLLKQYDEEFRDLEIIASSGVLGIRESRRIVGDYTLTTDDILNGAQFPDGLCTVHFGADIHTKSNRGQRCFSVKPYQIPFRCLLPKGWDGIVVAGRCISGTQEAMASYRVTGDCCAMGDAAGSIAAWAIREGKEMREWKKGDEE